MIGPIPRTPQLVAVLALSLDGLQYAKSSAGNSGPHCDFQPRELQGMRSSCSLAPEGPFWRQAPCHWWPALPLAVKIAVMSCLPSAVHGLWLVRVPAQYIVDFLYHWLQVLSLASWLGNCKDCRIVGCRPTLLSHVTRRNIELRFVEMALKPRSWASSALSLFLLNQESGCLIINLISFCSSVQLLSHVRLFATPWTATHQGSLSTANSRSLLKLKSIESLCYLCVVSVTSDAAGQLPTLVGWGFPSTPAPPQPKKKKNTCDQLEKLSGAEEQWTAVTSESSV